MRVTLTLTPGRHPTPGGVPAAGTPAASVEVAASQNSRTERLRRFAVAFSLDTTPSPMSQAATSWLTAPSLFRTGRAPWFHHPAYAIALPLRRRPGRDPDERLGRRVGGRRGLQADAPGVEAAKHLGRVARQEGALRGGGAPLEVVEQARAARVVEPDPGRHEAEAQVRGRGVPARRHVVGRRVPHRLRHAYSPLRRVPGSRSGAPRTSSGGPPGCSTRAPTTRIPWARPYSTVAPAASTASVSVGASSSITTLNVRGPTLLAIAFLRPEMRATIRCALVSRNAGARHMSSPSSAQNGKGRYPFITYPARHPKRATCGAKTTTSASAAKNPILRRSEEHTSELQSQSNLVCR